MKRNYVLFDSEEWHDLLPLTYTRPVSQLRIGILTIEEKWKIFLNSELSHLTQEYLSKKFSLELSDDNTFINSSVIPERELLDLIIDLPINSGMELQGKVIIARLDKNLSKVFKNNLINFNYNNINITKVYNVSKISHLWDIFQKADQEIRTDFQLLSKAKISQKLSSSNILIGPESDLFIEADAKIEASIINTSRGPVYISKKSEIMEGCMVRGPFFMDENSTLKMGAKIYGPTSLGKHCKVGGEVNNSNFMNYSNKAHDGFLGNSVLGEWCNLGADTNNSNLKNNYATVKLWNFRKNSFFSTGQQFCGLFMGDHSKAGINTMFNTGTVVGVSANIFGAGFPRNFIPSFSWGGNHGFVSFEITKALETAKIMMARRNIDLDETDKEILTHIWKETAKYRIWEKK